MYPRNNTNGAGNLSRKPTENYPTTSQVNSNQNVREAERPLPAARQSPLPCQLPQTLAAPSTSSPPKKRGRPPKNATLEQPSGGNFGITISTKVLEPEHDDMEDLSLEIVVPAAPPCQPHNNDYNGFGLIKNVLGDLQLESEYRLRNWQDQRKLNEELKAGITALQKSFNELNKERTNMEERHKEEMNEKDAQISAATLKYNNFKDHSIRLLDAKRKEIANKDADNVELQRQNGNLRRALDDRVNNMHAEIQAGKNELKTKIEEVKNKQEELEDVTFKYKRSMLESEQYKADTAIVMKDLEARLKKMQNMVENWKQEMLGKETAIKDAEKKFITERNKLQGNIESKRILIDQKKYEIEAIKKEKAAVEEELKAKTKECEELSDKYKTFLSKFWAYNHSIVSDLPQEGLDGEINAAKKRKLDVDDRDDSDEDAVPTEKILQATPVLEDETGGTI